MIPNAFPTQPAGGGEESRLDKDAADVSNKELEASSTAEGDPEETEDEEVKVNCIGGFNGVCQSDMSAEESGDDDDSLGDSDEEPVPDGAREDGVVQFGTKQESLAGLNIQRPVAIFGLANMESQSTEEVDEVAQDDASSMDESSDSSSCGARGIGLSLEVTKLHEPGDEDSVSDASSQENNDDYEVSSAGGIAGSASGREDNEDEEGINEDDDDEDEVVPGGSRDEDMMSDDESTTSVPLACFKSCDGPSDVAELESALQDSKHEKGTSPKNEPILTPSRPSALLSEITELGAKSPREHALSHAKRVLSSSALLGPVSSSGRAVASPKRVCRASGQSDDVMPPELALGSAPDISDPEIGLYLRMEEEDNPAITPSEEDEQEQDRQLGEELEEASSEEDRVNTPIPLLTPPGSPLRVESEEGTVEVCEWPSNLAVENAMTAAMDLRPPSPSSLQTWEQKEEERLASTGIELSPETRTGEQVPLSSTLTPMMRGISVEVDAPYLRL